MSESRTATTGPMVCWVTSGHPGRVVARAAVTMRRTSARRPWVPWTVIAVLAAVVAGSVHTRLAAVDARRDSWGTTRVVAVATAPADVGDPLRVTHRPVPAAVVPLDAVSADEPTDGWTARRPIGIGEIVTRLDVASAAGPRALTPDGWLGVPVVESPPSGARVGDRVTAVSDGIVLATDALVVGRLDDVTLVAVPAAVAPLLPSASTAGGLTLLLQP